MAEGFNRDISKLLPAIKKGKQVIDQENKGKSNVQYQENTFYDNAPIINNLDIPVDDGYTEPKVSNQVLMENLSKSKLPSAIKDSLLNQPLLSGEDIDLDLNVGLNEQQIREINPDYGTKRQTQAPRQSRPVNRQPQRSNQPNVDPELLRKIIREEMESIMGKLLLNSGSRKQLTEDLNLDLEVGSEIVIVNEGRAYTCFIDDVKKVRVKNK